MNDKLSAAWVLVVGSVLVAWWYWSKKRLNPAGQVDTTASRETIGTPGIAPQGTKTLKDLLGFASFNQLRAVENESGHYTLVPYPGWRLDLPGLAATARQQGFNASATPDQLYIDVPYEGETPQGNIAPPIQPPPYRR